jgi:hypothetical protein
MKLEKLIGLLLCLVGPPLSAAENAAPGITDRQAEALQLLRRTIAEQQKNQNKVIRNLTNLPPVAPSVTSRTPTATVPTLAGSKVPPPPATVAPLAPGSSYSIPETFPTPAELERAYLDKKISARDFEKALQLLIKHQKLAEDREQKMHQALSDKNPSERQRKISDAEAKLDDLTRWRAEREKAALTNAVTSTNNVPAGSLTKRQRLDALLKQLIEGKISDADYNVKRNKIVLEPD